MADTPDAPTRGPNLEVAPKGAHLDTSPKGATLHTLFVARTIQVYPITEPELKALSLFNTAASVFLALGSALISFMAGIRVDLSIETGTPAPTRDALGILCWVLAILAVASYGIAALAWCKRKSQLDKIEATTENPKDSAPPPKPVP